MQVLRLLAPRRGAATTMTAPTAALEPADDSKLVDVEEEEYDDDEDEGSFFELDLSVRSSSSSAGSASASSGSSDDSDDALSLTDLDFVISLHRSRSASPSFHFPRASPLTLPSLDLKPGYVDRGGLRALSFARATTASTRNAPALYGGGRRSSFARSTRSLRLFMESPASPAATDATEDPESEQRRAPSRDVIRRYFTKISTRLRRSVRPRRGVGEGGFRRLRKSRSASAAVTTTTATAPAASRRDDSLAEKQDGIASAIAHCKESLHRASLSLSLPDCGSSLPRSRSDPGKRQAT